MAERTFDYAKIAEIYKSMQTITGDAGSPDSIAGQLELANKEMEQKCGVEDEAIFGPLADQLTMDWGNFSSNFPNFVANFNNWATVVSNAAGQYQKFEEDVNGLKNANPLGFASQGRSMNYIEDSYYQTYRDANYEQLVNDLNQLESTGFYQLTAADYSVSGASSRLKSHKFWGTMNIALYAVGAVVAAEGVATIVQFAGSTGAFAKDANGEYIYKGAKGISKMGGDTPGGGENPGGENPGGENPGGENPGGENPGNNPGGENPGNNPGGSESPTGGSESPTGGSEAPTGGSEAPTGGSEAPTGGSEAPAGGSEAPTGGSGGTGTNGVDTAKLMHQRNGYLGAAEKARRAGDAAKAAEWEAKAAELETQYYEARAALSGTSLSSGPTTSAAGSVPGLGSAVDTGATVGSTLPTSTASAVESTVQAAETAQTATQAATTGAGAVESTVQAAETAQAANNAGGSILKQVVNHEAGLLKTVVGKGSTMGGRAKAATEIGMQGAGVSFGVKAIRNIVDGDSNR